MKKQTKVILIAAVAVIVLVGSIIGIIIASSSSDKPLTAAELLDLGEKYLLELNYEQAKVYFTRLIEVEPMNARGYTGAAEAYVGLGEPEKAVAVLKQGLVVLPANVEIAEKLAEVESILFPPPPLSSEPSVEPSSDPSIEPTVMPEVLSDADNLTGHPIFSPTDFEQWESPMGLSFHEVISIYDCDESMMQWIVNGEIDGVGILTKEPFEIGVDSESMIVSHIQIKNDAGIKGPRGVHVGMTMYDVLLLFACSNQEALSFAQNPSNDRSEIAYYNDIYLYSLNENRHRAFISRYGKAYDIYGGDFSVIFDWYEGSYSLTLHMYFSLDGRVNRIFAGKSNLNW
jgi:tetratricopeptide (TPR) repeat protein